MSYDDWKLATPLEYDEQDEDEIDVTSWRVPPRTVGVFRDSFWCLSHNIATAGALCRAHELGYEDFRRVESHGRHLWRPGCGKAAP